MIQFMNYPSDECVNSHSYNSSLNLPVVAAVVDAVADGCGQGALLVRALELTLAALARRARGRLVRPVLAVDLPVTPEGNCVGRFS